MSEQDYIEVEDSLFASTGEEENRDYYQEEANNYTLPDPKEASKEYEKEEYENIEEDEENAYDSFSRERVNIQYKNEPPIVPKNNVMENAETENVYKTRMALFDRIVKIKSLSYENAELYSRIITNKLWYNMEYNKEIENTIIEIFDNINL
jgi:hypothetical protein